MGETIFSGLARQKWWGPVVLDAAPKPASHLVFLRERPLQRLVEAPPFAPKTVFLHAGELPLSLAEGTNGQRKDNLMARSKPSARNALKKLREQREELDAQEARLRDEAAGELGKVLLECGAETIEPAQLKQLIRASLTIGIGDALKRLSPA